MDLLESFIEETLGNEWEVRNRISKQAFAQGHTTSCSFRNKESGKLLVMKMKIVNGDLKLMLSDQDVRDKYRSKLDHIEDVYRFNNNF